MSNRNLGIAIIVVGVLVILISLFADAIGIGANQGIFGWKQILGVCVGVVVSLFGVFLSRRK